MNRRLFLRWLGGTAAGLAASHVLDVDRLLWVPGERTIFLPRRSVTLEYSSADVCASIDDEWFQKILQSLAQSMAKSIDAQFYGGIPIGSIAGYEWEPT